MIEQEILEAINSKLPAMVGDVLKKRLEELSKLTNEVYALKERHKEHIEKIASLEKAAKDWDERDKQILYLEEQLRKTEAATLNKALVDLTVKTAEEKAQFAKDIVAMVFANNKYKYSESGTVPVFVPPTTAGQYGFTQTGPFSKAAEGEQ